MLFSTPTAPQTTTERNPIWNDKSYLASFKNIAKKVLEGRQRITAFWSQRQSTAF